MKLKKLLKKSYEQTRFTIYVQGAEFSEAKEEKAKDLLKLDRFSDLLDREVQKYFLDLRFERDYTLRPLMVVDLKKETE